MLLSKQVRQERLFAAEVSDMCILLSLLFGSSSDNKSDKIKERERRCREEELEEEYDEIDGIEDADY